MLARVVQKSVRAAAQPAFSARSFASGTLSIPTDMEQQSGRRKEEMEAKAAGQVGFNRDPIVPAADAGTRANPIMVRTDVIMLGASLAQPTSFIFTPPSLTLGTLHSYHSIRFYLLPTISSLQVPSGMPFRAVGFEDPSTHVLHWFNLTKDKIHYVPSIGLFFKMQPIGGL